MAPFTSIGFVVSFFWEDRMASFILLLSFQFFFWSYYDIIDYLFATLAQVALRHVIASKLDLPAPAGQNWAITYIQM